MNAALPSFSVRKRRGRYWARYRGADGSRIERGLAARTLHEAVREAAELARVARETSETTTATEETAT